MSLAKYFFIPWIREGLGSRIEDIADDSDLLNEHRSKSSLSLQINEKSDLINKGVEFFGPGDVVGIDQNIIARTDPKNNVGDFEPNFFPMIEFWEEDLPWMITPARITNSQWQPFVCLIVLKNPKNLKDPDDEEGEFYEPIDFDNTKPARYITVKSIKKSLPDLNFARLWAHAQVTDEGNELINIPKIKQIVETSPELIVSRIVCPRRLEPGILYTAFLVPTFETGRKAGLGIPLNETRLLDKAWDIENEDSIEIPYYHRWEFRTGLRGDFEHLVRLLEPQPLDSRVGKRFIDCSSPGFEVRAPDDSNLKLEGALRPVGATSDTCSESLKNQLKEKLNLPEKLLSQDDYDNEEEHFIVPPIYGKWHAAVKKIQDSNPTWIKQLNLEPRHRATANFGTEVIQSRQEELMHEAWRQVGAVEEANQRIREAQMAVDINKKNMKKLQGLSQNVFIGLTAPLHSRLLSYENDTSQRSTIKGYLAKTTLPAVVFDPGFRKTFRKRGIVRYRQKNNLDENKKNLLDRMNEGEIQGAGPAPLPDGNGSLNQVTDDLRPSWATGWLWKILKILPLILLILFVIGWLLVFILNQLGINIPFNNPVFLLVEFLLLLGGLLLHRKTLPGRIADGVREEKITPEFLDTVKPPDNFPNPEEFRVFAKSIQNFLIKKPEITFKPQEADLKSVHAHLVQALEPKKNILNKLKTRVRYKEWNDNTENIEQIMAAPKFLQPMYEPLRDLSQDYLLPGLEYVQQNTITLLETNQDFVEAYMTGLNVEFTSEMFWREYPTDQRCTCFRQFWDVSEVIFPSHLKEEIRTKIEQKRREELNKIENEGEREERINELIEDEWEDMLKDITPIHKWKKSLLGKNKGQSDQNLEDKLVLLIRGDLLKKYPSTVIYALKAKWKENTTGNEREPDLSYFEPRSEVGNTEGIGNPDNLVKRPVFKGTLKPDITFLGFNLTEDQARGFTQRFATNESGETIENDPGWFFVIEEIVSESRFGLDAYINHDQQLEAATKWDDLSWGHFFPLNPNENEQLLSGAGYINGAEPRTNMPSNSSIIWGDHSANIAHITLQKPVRITIHADDMLPEKQAN